VGGGQGARDIAKRGNLKRNGRKGRNGKCGRGVNQAKLLTLRGNARVNGRDRSPGMTEAWRATLFHTFAGGKAGACLYRESRAARGEETLESGEMEGDAAAVALPN